MPGPRIHIYGFGRSGTKAVQLWLAFALARRAGRVCVQYEPLEYSTRKLVPSPAGRRAHQQTPIVCAPTDHVVALERFCKRLRSDIPTVCKFVRGNGRIRQIDTALRPDLSILLVRDVRAVVRSIAAAPWSLMGPSDWHRIVQQARIRHPFLQDAGWLEQDSGREVRNAVYWYLANEAALASHRGPQVVRYGDWEHLREIALPVMPELNEAPDLADPRFAGDQIHRDNPLVDCDRHSRLLETASRRLGQVSARLSERALTLLERTGPVGSVCRIDSRKDPPAVVQRTARSPTTLESNPVLERMQAEIDQLVDARYGGLEAP